MLLFHLTSPGFQDLQVRTEYFSGVEGFYLDDSNIVNSKRSKREMSNKIGYCYS